MFTNYQNQIIPTTTGTDIRALDERRIYTSTLIYSFISIPFLMIFAVVDLVGGSVQLGLVLLANAVFAFFMQVLTIYKKNPAFIRNSCTLQISAIAIYLLVTGGQEGTGLLWTFVVPNITYFMMGLKRGTILTLLYLITINVLFFATSVDTVYSTTEKIRYLGAYSAVSLFAAGFEYSRDLTVNQLGNVNRRFKELAISDPLTKLFNRNGFHNAIEKIIPLLKRNNEYYAVLILDLDRFKQINDEYGHAAGDLVIVRVADVLMSNLRENDVAARWGGEEYLVFLPATGKDGAVRVAETIRKSVDGLMIQWKDHTLQVKVSIGVAVSRTMEVEKLISIADKKLYQAKERNGNSVVV